MPDHVVSRKPDWLKVQLNTNDNFKYVKRVTSKERLTTVCEEARCPNIHECWGQHRTATFMILGEICTRRCRFCSVETGLPTPVDPDEPARVAHAVAEMQLKHAVVTMVNRDDLPDGGAAVLAETVRAIHAAAPQCSVEVLSSDLMGDATSIGVVAASKPEILSHNLETVRRLTPQIRSRSTYDRSLSFLQTACQLDPETAVKSSLMLGLGETREEVLESMDDLLAVGVRILNMGQYLQPTKRNAPVEKYWTPDEFAELRERALEKGFDHCEAGPLVRSSYHADDQYEHYRKRVHPLYANDSVVAVPTDTPGAASSEHTQGGHTQDEHCGPKATV